VAVLLAMTLPAAAACYALGGSASRFGITALYGLLGLAALQLATMALLVSSRASSTVGALLVAYALMLAVCLAPLGPHLLLLGGSDVFAELAAWFRCLSPIPAVMQVLGQGDFGSQGMASDVDPAVAYPILAVLISVACALATVARLNQTFLDRARPSGVMTEDLPGWQQALRRLAYLVDPQSRTGGMSLWVNPVMVKEFRSRRFGRLHWMLRLVAVCAILSLGLSVVAVSGALEWGVERIGWLLVVLQAALLVLIAPSLAAGLVSAERESGSWQLLRLTPLSPGAILRGKLLSVALPLLLLLCATLPGYAVLMTIDPALVARVERVAACLALTAVFVVLLSAAAGALFRSTAAATTASYSAVLAVCGVPLLVRLGSEAPFGHATVAAALAINPVAAALQASEMPGFAEFELLPLNWWIVGAACLALLVFLRLWTWRLYRPE
jgi:ABC-type transport system involved in multi-copper enzyme maturation permease subunit